MVKVFPQSYKIPGYIFFQGLSSKGHSAGIIRMRVLFEGGSYMRNMVVGQKQQNHANVIRERFLKVNMTTNLLLCSVLSFRQMLFMMLFKNKV